MRRISLPLAVALFALATLVITVAACPPTTPPPAEPGPGTMGTGGVQSPALRAEGMTCEAAQQCQSGICEGEGCGGGVCVSSSRMCTQDLRSYCGCDGETFQSSGSCPGRLYAHRGECKSEEDATGGQQGQARADGAACSTAADCASGVCEGEGCGTDGGVCAPAQRGCTRDLRAYCGCDGVTFRSSGSCPGQRFAHKGECAARRADGQACLQPDDCASGVCEGQGCGDDTPGKCVSKKRMCTTDLRQYCGCDGNTFSQSGTCPGQRYAQRGACP